MWQIVLAAAVAGSGFLVKRFRDSNSCSKPSDEILEQPNLCQGDDKCGGWWWISRQTEVSAEEFDKLDNPYLKTYQDNGVHPSELHRKLRHVLLEQQESQIVELESELQQSHSKLNDKQVELQTLKDCIRRLTAVSLGSASDEETEAPEKSGEEQ